MKTVLIANPSPDVYGSDLQMLESVSAMTGTGWRVVVAIPSSGPLVAMLEARGAEVRLIPFPVLRRANASVSGILNLAAAAMRALVTLRRALKELRPDVVYVNTVTLPWWLLASRSKRIPAVCHVHEAERVDSRVTRLALVGPLVLANATIVISQSSLDAMCEVVPRLRRRAHLIFNGVPRPPQVTEIPSRGPGPRKLAIVARLSPRKAPDVALETVALLRDEGRDVDLMVCGTPFSGYEWFETELRARAGQPDLAGHVQWLGYVSPVWPVLEQADIVLAPSIREPFGNAVIEAQLANRPVVAAAAEGHLESISDGVTGFLVPPGNAPAMAAAVATLLDDQALSEKVAEAGRQSAETRFSVERYRSEVVQLLTQLSDRRT